jgi:hypothetical protein
VLAIIKDQQELPFTDSSCQSLRGDFFASEIEPEHAGHCGRHEGRVGQGRQLDKPPAVIKLGK